jgi:hypothetical protein
MTRATASRLAWSVFAVFGVMNIGGLVLLALVPAEALRQRVGDSVWLASSFVVVMLVFGVVGAVVASRQPRNGVGWLFLGLAALQGVTELAYGVTWYSVAVAPVPGEDWFGWVASWTSVLAPVLIGLAFLLFPDGRFHSSRWRLGGVVCVVAIIPVTVDAALAPGRLVDVPGLRNPAGVDAVAGLSALPLDACYLLILGTATAGLVARFRGSHGVERAQLKWFAWSAGLLTAYLPVSAVATLLVGDLSSNDDAVAGLIFAVGLCGLPVSVGVAVLRHRLYDVDLVINRTLVYGALTATLVLVYLVTVLAFRLALDPVTGDSDLAVAASTLAVAAAFRPARARIQAVVDRRFYRARYDAGRTVESFGGRLRAELDLESLGADLRRVVHDTVQPSHVSLWLREPT